MNTFKKILAMFLVATVILGTADFAMKYNDGGDIVEKLEKKYEEGDARFFWLSGVTLYGFFSILPAIPIDTLESIPVFGKIYAEWSRIFLPDGYIAVPSLATVTYLLPILLLTSGILWFVRERRRNANKSETILWGLPLAILLLIMLYPLWNALHIWIFQYGISHLLDISMEEAKTLYLSQAETMEFLSPFMLITTIAGFIGATTIGKKGWKG